MDLQDSFTAAKSIKYPTKLDFRQDVIDTAIDQWRKRLQACVRVNGGHFEHLL